MIRSVARRFRRSEREGSRAPGQMRNLTERRPSRVNHLPFARAVQAQLGRWCRAACVRTKAGPPGLVDWNRTPQGVIGRMEEGFRVSVRVEILRFAADDDDSVFLCKLKSRVAFGTLAARLTPYRDKSFWFLHKLSRRDAIHSWARADGTRGPRAGRKRSDGPTKIRWAAPYAIRPRRF